MGATKMLNLALCFVFCSELSVWWRGTTLTVRIQENFSGESLGIVIDNFISPQICQAAGQG
jgi:hypothetical protein